MSTGQGAYFGFEVFGFKELDDALQELQDIGTQKRVLISAMKKALEPVAELARQNVPVDSGDLRETIIVSTKITKRQARFARANKGVPRVYVGTNYPSAHLVEFGTGPRTTGFVKKKVLASGGNIYGTVAVVGAMPAQPFLRPAFEQKRTFVLAKFGEEMGKTLERTARRLKKQSDKGKLSKSGQRALGFM